MAPVEAAGGHAWERLNDDLDIDHMVDGFGVAAGNDSDDDFSSVSPGTELVGFCRELLHLRTLNARQFCVIMYYASEAGVVEAKPFAKTPGCPSGHYNRHIENHDADYKSGLFYELDVPSHMPKDLSRTTRTSKAMPFSEMLDQEMSENPGLRVTLREHVENRLSLPPAYWENPIVRRYCSVETPVLPYSIYLDFVEYSQTDFVLGFWVVNEISKNRQCFLTLRKRCVCVCGCKGWCTFDPIFRWIAKCMESLRDGTMPLQRHDSAEWRPSDKLRQQKAGQPLRFRAAILYLLGDWSEWSNRLGLSQWNDAMHPCWSCSCLASEFGTVRGARLFGFLL